MPQILTSEESTLAQVMACCWQQQAITWAKVDPDLWEPMLTKMYYGG